MIQIKQPKNPSNLTTQPLKLSLDLHKSPFCIPYEQYNLTPIKIVDIYHNRHQLKIHGHKRAGIYLWLTPNLLFALLQRQGSQRIQKDVCGAKYQFIRASTKLLL